MRGFEGHGAQLLLRCCTPGVDLLTPKVVSPDAVCFGIVTRGAVLLFQRVQPIPRLAGLRCCVTVGCQHGTKAVPVLVTVAVREGFRVALVHAQSLLTVRTPITFLGGVVDLGVVVFDDDAQVAAGQIDIFTVAGRGQLDIAAGFLGNLDRDIPLSFEIFVEDPGVTS